MKLCDDWKEAYKWISVHAMVAAGALQATWVSVPDDWKASVPPTAIHWLTGILMVVGVFGRLVDQAKAP